MTEPLGQTRGSSADMPDPNWIQVREEVAMFDAVMRGVPVQAAIDRCMAEMKDKADDIELF